MRPTATEPMAGKRKLRFRLSTDVLRQASSGPTAVSSSRRSATGMATRLKNGGPTVTLCPWTHSERMGKNVPHRMVKQTTRRSRLLNRKLDSREASDSSLCSLLRWDRFLTRKKTQTAGGSAMETMDHGPMEECAKAGTEMITPEGVRDRPRKESKKVANT